MRQIYEPDTDNLKLSILLHISFLIVKEELIKSKFINKKIINYISGVLRLEVLTRF